MGYRDNVTAMATKLGLNNPLRERDLHIRSVIFMIPGQKGAKPMRVGGTRLNRGARCYLEQVVNGFGGNRPERIKWDSFDRGEAQTFFADLWSDRREKNRRMLIGFGDAAEIRPIWKP